MLFRKRIPRSCSYCLNATKLNDEQVLCVKRGVMPIEKSCHKFKYDPCKRVPSKTKASDFSKYDNEDYSL